MSAQYAIVAFPELDRAEQIASVRRRFDPMAGVLEAHITVVFPFADRVSENEITAHLHQGVARFPSFDITLSEISIDSVEAGGYIMLGVSSGADRLAELHGRLYSGILVSHLSSVHAYQPHVTVGRVASPRALANATEAVHRELTRPISGRVTELSLFRLDGVGTGTVVARSSLERISMRDRHAAGG